MGQSNGLTVTMDLVQTGKEVQGTGRYTTKTGAGSIGAFGKEASGPVTGSVDGTFIQLDTSWGAKYTGGVGSDAFIGGSTRDPDGNVATWRSDRVATCQVVAAEEPKKPVKKLGKRLPGTSTTSDLPQSLFATANDEVDIYDGPGGQFNVLQCQGAPCTMKPEDAKAKVLDHHQDGWYKLKGVADGADGWVAEDHLTVGP